MNFTGILIYLISARIPGGFIQQSRTFFIISKILNQKRQFQQLLVRPSRAVRAAAVPCGRAGAACRRPAGDSRSLLGSQQGEPRGRASFASLAVTPLLLHTSLVGLQKTPVCIFSEPLPILM